MRFSGLLAAAAFSLSACQSQVTADDIAAAGPPPENYRQIAATHLRNSLFDPYSVQDAQISAPRVHNSVSGPLWNVCFRGNAKNRFGAYTGISEVFMVIENGRVTVSDSDFASSSCAGAIYSPFPELT